MEFYSDEHKAKIARLEKLWENLHELADMCKEYDLKKKKKLHIQVKQKWLKN